MKKLKYIGEINSNDKVLDVFIKEDDTFFYIEKQACSHCKSCDNKNKEEIGRAHV